MKTQPTWLDKNLFPFESKWIKIDEHDLHYIDDGKGDTILFVHGTPEWSFGFRDLIKNLRHDYRCIAVDHLGFGLSDKPASADYSCVGHAARLDKFIGALGLKDFILVANDFGGSIGLNHAIHHPDDVRKIILFNTWMRSLKDDKHYAGPAKIMNTWLGKFLYLKLNFPVNMVMPAAFGDKKKLTKEIHHHYKQALPAGQRTAAYAFAGELLQASDWWEALWNKVDRIKNKQTLIFWGMKDKFVPAYELENWKSKLPGANIVTYDNAGHFVQEEKAEEMIIDIKKFIAHPLTP